MERRECSESNGRRSGGRRVPAKFVTRPLTLALAALLLLTQNLPPARAQEAGLPGWRVGDRWDYEVEVRSPYEDARGNATVVVVGEGRVRIGNETKAVYVLSIARREEGERSVRTQSSRDYVSKESLCTLYSKTTMEVRYGPLRSTCELTLVYSPSDGRYLFPLALNRSWRAEYNLTRTEVTSGATRVSSLRFSGNCTCSWWGELRVGRVNYTTCRIDRFEDGSANRSSYWYSDRLGAEVRREEYSAATGTLTTLTLKGHSRAPGETPILGPETGRILALLSVALALLGAAGALSLAQRRTRR
ncbi:MAG: hypothetical protein ACUVV6_00015 [Thermoplasmatota archaeon]